MTRTITCPSCGHHGSSSEFDVRQSRRPEVERFCEKVEWNYDNGCLEWQAGLNGNGYGSFKREDDSVVAAHVWAWEQERGPVPGGMCVCHSCDNRKCCNIRHLFLGTRTENNADRTAKGRSHCPKLTTDDVRAIREAKGKHSEIAQRFNINQSHVSRIKRGEAWGHLA